MNRRQRQRGFSLVEFGVVLGVIVTLTAVVGVRLQGNREVAMRQRLGKELVALGTMGQDYAAQTVTRSSTVGQIAFNATLTYRDSGQVADLVAGDHVIDLSDWNAVQLRNILRGMLGKSAGSGHGFDGLNPYDRPYELVLRRRRVLVQTCAPPEPAEDLVDLYASTDKTCPDPACPAGECSIVYSKARGYGTMADLAFIKRYIHQE